MFGGIIEGRNIELVPNQRIVQAWREASWAPGYYSFIKFQLVARGPGTHIVFDQTGIAEEDVGHLNDGWPIRYWDPLGSFSGLRSIVRIHEGDLSRIQKWPRERI